MHELRLRDPEGVSCEQLVRRETPDIIQVS